jgi:transcriptional activator of cad operon
MTLKVTMEPPAGTKIRIGAWSIDASSGVMTNDGTTARVEARTMRLLLYLAEHAGEVVSIDDLLEHVWSGVIVTPDSVYQAVASLRRLLGDDSRQPAYIATVPRLGYRLVAKVGPCVNPPPQRRAAFVWLAAAAVCVAVITVLLLRGIAATPQKSIAVLPFRDLTSEMSEEPFADGMTEELIDRLSKIPGIRVPSPRASFYFRGKRIPVADIARTLSVAYLLDGSVRKSGSRLRVSARLIRADSGYVVWSGAYDRPFGDILKIQDDIAGRVTNALTASIDRDRRRT